MNLEVLAVTMNQNDDSLYKSMNIRSDVVFANQCDRNEVVTTNVDGNRVTMVSTTTRGVGLNRNLALMYASGDILLCADDDIIYNNDYKEQVISAFENNPKADVLVFSIAYTKDGEVFRVKKNKNKRLRLWQVFKYGTCVVAFRRSSILRVRQYFTLLFGGGCKYSSGEDSLFLLDCIRNGLKVYSHEYCLGNCAKDSSSWFSGYTDKYFYDKGAWFRYAFPKAPKLLGSLYCYHLSRRSGRNPKDTLKMFNVGSANINSVVTYEEYINS